MVISFQSRPAKRGLAFLLVGGWLRSSWIACWVKEGCRWERGEGGGYLWFSAKLWRWGAMWPALWMLV